MAAFATPEDLATYLRTDFTAEDTATATQALDGASDVIRGYLQQRVDEVVDDVVTLWGTGTNMLQLPEIPVTGISQVQESGSVLDPSLYRFTSGGLLYRIGGRWPTWWVTDNTVEVTYTHGYNPIPDDIKWVTLHLASQNFGAQAGVQSETVGAYSVTYSSDDSSTAGLGEEDLAILDRYRLLRVG